jgi:Rieske Fe-S protein
MRHHVRGPLPEGLTVDGPVALWREGESVTAVSRRCPHLGCTVRPVSDGALACPCHGSRFDGRGQVERGPAKTDLVPLRVTRAEREGVVVDLPS